MYVKMHIEDELNNMISDVNSIKIATYLISNKKKLNNDDKII